MKNVVVSPTLRRRNRSFNPFFMDEFFNPVHRTIPTDKERTTPVLANISKINQDYLIEMTVPGFSKNDIKMTLDGHKLIVTGNKEISDTKYIKREFNLNNFERAFTLPEHVNLNEIEASVNDGVLRINIRAAAEKPMITIEVK